MYASVCVYWNTSIYKLICILLLSASIVIGIAIQAYIMH